MKMHRRKAVSRIGRTRADTRQPAPACTLHALHAWGIGAYLDDCTIVAPPRVAAIGLRAFRDAVETRGWAVNMQKTVCGVAYYVDDATEREEALRAARAEFHGMLRPDHVQTDGQVLLGTPLGGDSAGIAVSSHGYRERKLLDMMPESIGT